MDCGFGQVWADVGANVLAPLNWEAMKEQRQPSDISDII